MHVLEQMMSEYVKKMVTAGVIHVQPTPTGPGTVQAAEDARRALIPDAIAVLDRWLDKGGLRAADFIAALAKKAQARNLILESSPHHTFKLVMLLHFQDTRKHVVEHCIVHDL